jgi:PRTRC genetic system ThiF family protein
MSYKLMCPQHWQTAAPQIVLVGAGGTGSEVFDGLLRLHQALVALGHPTGLQVTVCDPDEVSPTNIARQRFHPGDEGVYKAELLVHRANAFAGTQWRAIPEAFAPKDCGEWDFDLLLTCVDSAQTRAQIAETARQVAAMTLEWSDTSTLWLDTGNDASRAQVVLGDLLPFDSMESDERPYIPHVVDLHPELVERSDDHTPSCSTAEALAEQDLFINRVTADTAIEMLWRLMRDGELSYHAAWIQLAPMRITSMPIDENQWALFGYTAEPA